MNIKRCLFFVFILIGVSCSNKEYSEKRIIEIFVKHGYQEFKEEEVRNLLKKGLNSLKEIDKNFEMINTKKKSPELSYDKKLNKLFYPFILKRIEDNYFIVKVFDYSIAYESGLRNGILKAINGKILSPNPCELNKEIDESKDLKLSFNDGKADWSINLKREISIFPFVWSSIVDDGIAYVNLVSLAKNSSKFFLNNLTNLRKRGIEKIILDLRDVSGGDYLEAAKIAGYFSKNKTTYHIKSSKKEYTRDFDIDENVFSNMKVVVIVNKKTALLGEIIAWALKESGAIVVGEDTANQLYITKMFRVRKDTAVIISVAKLFPPSLTDINGPIIPDYKAVYSNYKKYGFTYVFDCDEAFLKAFEIIKKI
jgi:carboxyl-terminal processing protease